MSEERPVTVNVTNNLGGGGFYRSRRHGIMWWLLIGWWWMPFAWICGYQWLWGRRRR